MSSHLKRHPLTDEKLPGRWDKPKPTQKPPPPSRQRRSRPRRASRWRNLTSWWEPAWVVVLTVAAIAGGSAAHKHYAPKEALCNTIGGELLQQHSTGLMTKCGLSSLASQLSALVYWGGLAMAALIGGLLLCWAAVAVRRRWRA